MSKESKSLIKDGLLKGTFSTGSGLRRVHSRVFAPPDGDVPDTMLLFHNKYRQPNGHDTDENHDLPVGQAVPCILPSGWRVRNTIVKAGAVYIYSPAEVREFNTLYFKYGYNTAKSWADRRWHER